jgi:release factor glutamine methyltransferase
MISNKARGMKKDGFDIAIRYLRNIKKPVHRHILGRKLIIYPGVFDPIFQDSQFLAEKLKILIPKGSRVLDMGTGSGIQAIFSASMASEVVAVDVNPLSIECAKNNASLNNLEYKIKTKQSDLFENLKGEKFDVIIWNPPFYDKKPRDMIEKACGDASNEKLCTFLTESKKYLRNNGFVILIICDSLNYSRFFDMLRKNRMTVEVVFSKFNKKNYHICKLYYK